MKKYIKLLTCALFATGMTSCADSLNEKIYSYQNQDDFYSNQDEANLGLNGVYAAMWSYIYKDAYQVTMGDIPGEILHSEPVPNEFDRFAWTVSTPQLDNFWLACYRGINRANTLIDNINPTIATTTRNEIVGQAKFLRALYYFHLVKTFGGVPLHIEATRDLSKVALPRSTEQEVYAQIITDLKEAETLMGPFSSSRHNAGYATSGSAKALLAKVYLQNKQWLEAAAKAKEVMDMGVYSLMADYSLLWRPDNRNNLEQIFSIQNGSNNNVPNMGDNTYYSMTVPKLMLNGKQVEFAIDGGVRTEVDTAYFRKEPQTHRLWNSARNKMPYYFPVGSYAIVNDTVQLERPYVVKYFHPDLSTKLLRSSVNTTVVRFSDMLITYAEATNELSGPTAEAIEALNRVRRRARAVGTPFEQPASVYPDVESGLTKEDFREVILAERGREFIGEGERRNDLNRHGLLLKAAAAQGAINVKAGYVRYPIPSNQIGLNPLLAQNDDY
jgi:hypothetical protein